MFNTYTVTPFLVALLVGLSAQALDIFEINAWNVGTAKTEPWRSKAESGVARTISQIRTWLGGAWRHRVALACVVLMAASVLWHPHVAEGSGVAMGMAMINIDALQRDKDKKLEEAKSLFASTSKKAEEEKRETTDEERAKVQGLLDEAKGLQSRIERAKGDQAMGDEIEKLLGQQPTNRTSADNPTSVTTKRGLKSMGRQFVESDQYAQFRKDSRSKGTRWSTGVVELQSELLDSDAGSPGSGGDLIVPDYRPGILPLLFRRLTIADLIAPGTTDSNAIIYMKETYFNNAADTVAEGATKPESGLRFDQVMDQVYKIAHWLPVTEEMLEDVPALRSYIDGRLRLGVQQTEEDKLLNGAASPAELTGLLNRDGLADSIAAGSASPDNPGADYIFRQMMAIFDSAFVMPDGIVINPLNWQTIQLMKDANGNYMGGGPFTAPVAPRLWGLPVVSTPAITNGTALVGAFRSAAQIFRKGGLRVEASNSHDDYFIRNLVAIRAEERLALAVYRPGAFGKVTGLD